MLDNAAGERLLEWVHARTGLDTYWSDQPERYEDQDYVLLTMGGQRRVGQDGIRYAFDSGRPEGQQMVPTVVGQREFTVRVEVVAWSQELSETAEIPLTNLEAALQLPSFQQLLLDLNLGLVSTGPLVQTDQVADERMLSRAAIDIVFATSIQVSDADEGQSYIETAEVETTLQGAVAGDLVTQQQVGDVESP